MPEISIIFEIAKLPENFRRFSRILISYSVEAFYQRDTFPLWKEKIDKYWVEKCQKNCHRLFHNFLQRFLSQDAGPNNLGLRGHHFALQRRHRRQLFCTGRKFYC